MKVPHSHPSDWKCHGNPCLIAWLGVFFTCINPSLSQVVHKHCIFTGRHSKFHTCAISCPEDKPLPICSEPEVTLSGAKGSKAELLRASHAACPFCLFYVLVQWLRHLLPHRCIFVASEEKGQMKEIRHGLKKIVCGWEGARTNVCLMEFLLGLLTLKLFVLN